MNKRHYEHTLPNIRGSLSNTYIGLVDVDGHNFPNFALMRLSAYNKAKGCQVE